MNRIANKENPFEIMGKSPFEKSLLICSRLREKVHIFNRIVLKLAQIVCIIVRIKPNENVLL